MNWFELIGLAFALLKEGYPLPDWRDEAAVKAWLAKTQDPQAKLIVWVALTLDRRVVESLPDDEKELEALVAAKVDEYMKQHLTDDDTEIDPATIITIIIVVVKLIKWWRDRRTA
jgi:hypothetical protein